MTIVHVLVGVGAAGAAVAAAYAYAVAWPRRRITTFAGWALGLLVVQVASGMFLITGGGGGPGLVHIVVPLVALALVAGARLLRPEPARTDGPILGAVFAVAATGVLVGLVTGLAGG